MFHLITDLVLLGEHLATLKVQGIVVDLEILFNLRLMCYQPIINVHSLRQVSVFQLSQLLLHIIGHVGDRLKLAIWVLIDTDSANEVV